MVKTATGNAPTAKITEVTTRVITLLTPLSSEDRQRVMRASFTLLGETFGELGTNGSPTPPGDHGAGKGSHSDQSSKPRATSWMKTNNLTEGQLEQVFDITSTGVDVIGTNVPGKSAKEQTLNGYVLEGIRSLLATGEANFDDKSARKLCVTIGCFNTANHAVYMKEKGNMMSGSKDKGWKLTVPGLTRGAELVREIAKG